MNKITKKQKFEAMIAYFKGEEAEVTLTETDFIEFCEDQIVDLDKKAAKAKERAAAKKAEADELTNLVHSVLTEEYQTIADIATAVVESDPDATTAKVTNRLSKLFNAGAVEKEQISVADSEGKKRKVMAYRLKDISAPVEEDEE